MKLKTSYPHDFAQVMRYLKMQADDGIDHFRDDYGRSVKTGRDIWEELKPRVTYYKDPRGVELFQSYQTLFYDNYYGVPGAGDCDCFVISCLTACLAGNIPYQIVLAGRSKSYPVHIYMCITGKVVDLTRTEFDSARHYPYLQKFSFP